MAVPKMTLKINGVDFSPLTERLGYSIVYEDRLGGNTTVMMNGDEYQDVIVRKPVLTWRLDSLTKADLRRLHLAINAAVYVQVSYYDAVGSATKTAYFHGTISTQEIGLMGPGGHLRFRAPILTMRAR